MTAPRMVPSFARVVRRPYAILILTLTLILSSLSVGSVTAVEGGGISPAQEVQNALNFRRTFGFSTDLSIVEPLASDPSADRSYSTALTPAEVAEMDRRMEIQNDLGRLQAYGRAHADVFGGGFIDQVAGAVIDLAFTDDIERHRAELGSRAPDGAVLRLRQVDRSEANLDQLVADITNDAEFHASIGVQMGAAATDIPDNTVRLEINPYSESAAAQLEGRYGPAVEVLGGGEQPQLTACYNRDDCIGPPLRAGISTTYGCTVGFLVNEDGANRWMTAGHCAEQNYNWYHSAQYYDLGYVRDERWYDGSPADVATVGNVSSSYMSNRVYYKANSWFGMYSAQSASSDFVGQAICQSASNSGYRCGTIQSRNVSVDYWDTACGCYTTMTKQRRANYYVQGGDSGSPVINSSNTNQAVGLQSGMDGSYTAYYSQISNGLSLLNATLRTIDY